MSEETLYFCGAERREVDAGWWRGMAAARAEHLGAQQGGGVVAQFSEGLAGHSHAASTLSARSDGAVEVFGVGNHLFDSRVLKISYPFFVQ